MTMKIECTLHLVLLNRRYVTKYETSLGIVYNMSCLNLQCIDGNI